MIREEKQLRSVQIEKEETEFFIGKLHDWLCKKKNLTASVRTCHNYSEQQQGCSIQNQCSKSIKFLYSTNEKLGFEVKYQI